jgi:hypothetical protein
MDDVLFGAIFKMYRDRVVLPTDLNGDTLEGAGLLDGTEGRHLEAVSAGKYYDLGAGRVGNCAFRVIFCKAIIHSRRRSQGIIISIPAPDGAKTLTNLGFGLPLYSCDENSTANFKPVAGVNTLFIP